MKDNELIARFMGGKTKAETLPSIAGRMEDGDFWIPAHGIYMSNLMEYHKSWDWLMPVCVKLGMETVPIDIKTAYEHVINRIKNEKN